MWTKWHWDRFMPISAVVHHVSLNPALLHNHSQLDITLITRTSVRSLGNLKKAMLFQLWGIKREKIYHVIIQGQNFFLLIIRISG